MAYTSADLDVLCSAKSTSTDAETKASAITDAHKALVDGFAANGSEDEAYALVRAFAGAILDYAPAGTATDIAISLVVGACKPLVAHANAVGGGSGTYSGELADALTFCRAALYLATNATEAVK